jgi:hypothetical protein
VQKNGQAFSTTKKISEVPRCPKEDSVSRSFSNLFYFNAASHYFAAPGTAAQKIFSSRGVPTPF